MISGIVDVYAGARAGHRPLEGERRAGDRLIRLDSP